MTCVWYADILHLFIFDFVIAVAKPRSTLLLLYFLDKLKNYFSYCLFQTNLKPLISPAILVEEELPITVRGEQTVLRVT